MELIRVILLSLYLFTQTNCLPEPGNTHHHIHHRIHVPEKIHKVYHTKIVKVPEHHHYFHEKEKIIKVEVPKKEEPHYPPLKSEEFSGYEDHHSYYGDGEHNIFKKHATISSSRKLRRRKVPRNVKH